MARYVNAHCNRCHTTYMGMAEFVSTGRSQCPSCCSKSVRVVEPGEQVPEPTKATPFATHPQTQTQPAPKNNEKREQKTKPAKVAATSAATENAGRTPPSVSEGNKKPFGKYGACEVIRWLGKNGFGLENCKNALKASGVENLPCDGTIRAQLLGGVKGRYGDPATLTQDEAQKMMASK